MLDVLQAVFGRRWVGQQRFTTTAEIDALHAAALPIGALDAIVSHNVWLTIANKAYLFDRCRRMLRPGGRMASTLIVQTGTGLAPPRQPTDIAWPIPTADDYREYAEQAGLRVRGLVDVTRSFREVCARWRGALIVWDVALLQ
jgi:hypothetical protein